MGAPGEEVLPEDLAPARITGRLVTRRLGHPIEALVRCESTNDRVASHSRQGAPEGLLVVADSQSGGRGRLGRTWHSPPGENLYFSVLLRPERHAATLPPLTLLVGAVLAEVLAALGTRPLLKWPNDLLLDVDGNLRKVGGVLTEMASDRDRIRHVVVGIGLNINGTAFPPDLAARATSLRMATGVPHDRGQILAAVLNALEPAYDTLLTDGPGPCLARWRAFARLPRRYRIEREGQILDGLALDVDDQGALLVEQRSGQVQRLFSGELFPYEAVECRTL
jgi:BirA family transcriptional regulator, biotin operon repressor / biotin---[acetyl-CoA-carboxylase] ligase